VGHPLLRSDQKLSSRDRTELLQRKAGILALTITTTKSRSGLCSDCPADPQRQSRVASRSISHNLGQVGPRSGGKRSLEGPPFSRKALGCLEGTGNRCRASYEIQEGRASYVLPSPSFADKASGPGMY